MLPTLLTDALRCPHCVRALDVTEAEVRCPVCNGAWPIQNGIPRFVHDQHLASFGRQWNRYEVAHDDEDRATFAAKTGVPLSDLRGLKVLDAGCGGGRYSKVCAQAGATVIGADHSSAVEKASTLCAGLDAAFLQADLKALPLAPQSFDLVFSIGVMHHDADTRMVFDSVASMVKPGGRYAVWLYRRNQSWQERLNTWLRSKTTRMPPDNLERWCVWGARLGGLPVVNRTLNKVINFSAHPNFENRVCDTFDWWAPEYQHHHTVAELLHWFEVAGFTDLQVLPPERTGPIYRRIYENNLLIGSGVNVLGVRR